MKNKIRGIREISLFLIIVLVFSIIGFSWDVSAAVSKSPNNLVVINMQQGQKCGIEVGKEEEFAKYEADVENGGNGLVNSFDKVKDKTKDIHLAMNPGFNGIDKATEEAIKTRCHENVFNLAKQVSNKPDSFSGKINFEKGELKEFKNFQFEKLDKPLKIGGFGEIKGDGGINTAEDINNLVLDNGGSFKFDENAFGKVNTKLNKLGKGNWYLQNGDNSINIEGGGLINIKGANGWENNPLNVKSFKATLDKNGNYVNYFNAKLDDSLFDNKNPYRTIDLNGRFADLTKNTNLGANFNEKGLLTEMRINAVGGDVNGFGYDGIKGIDIDTNSFVNLKPAAYNDQGGQYRLFASKEYSTSWQFDKNNADVKYLLSNNEGDLLVNTNGKEVTSASLDNTQGHSFLVKKELVEVSKLTKMSATAPATRPAVNTPLDIAKERINLITSGDPNHIGKIRNPAIQFVTKNGETGLIMNDKVTNMNILGNTKSLANVQDGVFEIGRDLRGSPLSQIAHVENNGVLRTYDINPQTGQIRDLKETLVKTDVRKEEIRNLFTGKKELIGDVSSKSAPSKIGSGATEKSGNGLTWLLVIGGVGAVAAYAFSKSGDKDKDKNKEKDVKNK
ncbi:hypothetical protein HYV88_01780 [Candidatus Woesearchaeota archaeon]|nr:hypothetical protein [Candidatus Woesearchaeota archaeon]